MQEELSPDGLPPELVEPIRQTGFLSRSYVSSVAFIAADTSGDPKYGSDHILYFLYQDLIQSALSISTLVTQGLLNVARRELRFLIEASVKITHVQQASYISSIEEKLELFNKELRSPSISIKKEIKLDLLPHAIQASFDGELGRIYGLTSNYVHLTPTQILHSIEGAKAGVKPGRERPEDVNELNRLAERAMAASLVLLFHSVPSWVAGDWLVNSDGSSIQWHFMKSQYIAAIDEEFDYKHERQGTLSHIKAARARNVDF
ncbi:hypothetical protein [Methylobacterium sp. Leaf85]|uniref:hypothetical protein n=1 Tax=Methylobacterium sp. Leaf85 TaxID=1736241 RepID=UPI000B137F5C|nr:hypothetical protein [Methylobacterium sp. Leaf85]